MRVGRRRGQGEGAMGYRVVHYLNQFFGGIGGEEKAGISVTAAGGGTMFEDPRRIGATLAEEWKRGKMDAVVLVST